MIERVDHDAVPDPQADRAQKLIELGADGRTYVQQQEQPPARS